LAKTFYGIVIQGGDFPSQNIRTAPTPSNPNTPIVSDPSYGHLGGSQYSGEEEVRDQTSSEQVGLKVRQGIALIELVLGI